MPRSSDWRQRSRFRPRDSDVGRLSADRLERELGIWGRKLVRSERKRHREGRVAQ